MKLDKYYAVLDSISPERKEEIKVHWDELEEKSIEHFSDNEIPVKELDIPTRANLDVIAHVDHGKTTLQTSPATIDYSSNLNVGIIEPIVYSFNAPQRLTVRPLTARQLKKPHRHMYLPQPGNSEWVCACGASIN